WLYVVQFRIGEELIKCTFKLTNVGFNIVRKELNGFSIKGNSREPSLSINNCTTSFEVGHLNINTHSHFETATKTFSKGWNTLWRFIARDNNLLVVLVQEVKGMEEFFLRLLFISNKLHVV